MKEYRNFTPCLIRLLFIMVHLLKTSWLIYHRLCPTRRKSNRKRMLLFERLTRRRPSRRRRNLLPVRRLCRWPPSRANRHLSQFRSLASQVPFHRWWQRPVAEAPFPEFKQSNSRLKINKYFFFSFSFNFIITKWLVRIRFAFFQWSNY